MSNGKTNNMIEIRGLMKKFGRREVLKGIGFSAGAGEPITLLGPNGAGKTTLMRVICGYLAPDAGSVRICGLSYENDRPAFCASSATCPKTRRFIRK